MPKAIRERLALRQGDRFRVAIGRDGSLTLEREQPPPIASAYGMLRRLAGRKAASIAEMRAALRERARRKQAAKRA